MVQPPVFTLRRSSLVRAVGCLAYPVGLGLVVAVALCIRSLV
ncbi:hypothetical protein [Brevundimonas sp. LM2]|nr:hypothetical protein [Brevundimonas sp. LM2]